MFRPNFIHVLCAALCVLAALFASSCAVPLAPGYTIEKQNVEVHFASASDPRIEVQALYELRNTGNQPLPALEIILPDQARYNASDARIEWDGAPLTPEVRSDKLGRIGRLTFASPWAARARHSLQIAYSISPPAPGSEQMDFAPDAFFLPAEGWNPALRPPPGVFASGGGPPARWRLAVRVPQNFLVHSSGKLEKTGTQGAEKVARFVQRRGDLYPFVVAGQYTEAAANVGAYRMHVWTRSPLNPELLRSVAAFLSRVTHAYDAVFGPRSNAAQPVRLVECPARSACGESSAPAGALPGPFGQGRIMADGAFLDPALLTASPSAESIATAAAHLLVPTWLGYGNDPDFWHQELPMSELQALAAVAGREALEGPPARAETIRRALAGIPQTAATSARAAEPLSREKSLLFFFALEDQFGRDPLYAALRHIVQARRRRGYDLDDLIAALEAETRKPVAPFARSWLKHPGIPEEFRARYAGPAAPANTAPKENPQ